MSELQSYISQKSPVFMPYISLGDPTYEHSLNWAKAISPQADLLELGIPFSDPVADGPVIQKSYKRALDNQPFTMEKILEITKQIYSDNKIPIVYLTYLNPIIQYGLDKFFKNSYTSGVRGIVIPDIPFDSKDYIDIFKIAKKNNINIINLITPATSLKRIRLMKEYCGGFIYYVTSFGVTGERQKISTDIKQKIETIKSIINIPVLAGFGISEPQQASDISKISDGIIIGSRIQKIIEEDSKDINKCMNNLTLYTKEIRESVKAKI